MHSPSPTALLLTGRPGVGKTTVIREVVRRLSGTSVAGFYTEEIREAGMRRGFRLVPFEGPPRIMAHVDLSTGHRVSRYGVDVEMLEAVSPTLLAPSSAADLFVIDEIGRMECSSPGFVSAVRQLLDAGWPTVATVGARGGGLIAEVKARSDTDLLQVTRSNRGSLPDAILTWIDGRLLHRD
jgi:nucleoside-triphosphatase